MFSGIIETTSPVLAARARAGVLEIQVARPPTFTDLTIGDSIACDGVCLTLEKFDEQHLTFALGPETLTITGWDSAKLVSKKINLERSLRLNDRIHGHLVTGHVDARGEILNAQHEGETLRLTIGFPQTYAPYIWPKGSVAVNGVSLTLNRATRTEFDVGLIPETLKRTNLGELKKGDGVNLEIDNMARGLVHFAKLEKEMAP